MADYNDENIGADEGSQTPGWLDKIFASILPVIKDWIISFLPQSWVSGLVASGIIDDPKASKTQNPQASAGTSSVPPPSLNNTTDINAETSTAQSANYNSVTPSGLAKASIIINDVGVAKV